MLFQIIYIDGLTPYTWAEVLDEYVNLEVKMAVVLVLTVALTYIDASLLNQRKNTCLCKSMGTVCGARKLRWSDISKGSKLRITRLVGNIRW
jgi:hypothetical protein